MSRTGKKKILLRNAEVLSHVEGSLRLKGPKGEVVFEYPKDILLVENKGVELIVSANQNGQKNKKMNAQHGLYRTLLANAVKGVTEGFYKELELNGVGYRVQKEGEAINFSLGYSHPVKINPPKGIRFEVEGQNKLKIQGIDKQLVGQVAANIRVLRKPDPYKEKGIKYFGEKVRRKAGKSTK